GGEQTVTNNELGFEITFPEDLKVEEDQHPYGSPTLSATSPNNRFRCRVRVVQATERVGLKEFVAERKHVIGIFGLPVERTNVNSKLGMLDAYRVSYAKEGDPPVYDFYFALAGKR